MKNKNKPPYLLGLLSIIPLLGFFVGILLAVYGIFKYKDKKLTLIGVAGIVFSIIIYGWGFYQLKYGRIVTDDYKEIAQRQLNLISNEIEMYKIKQGAYPDHLSLIETKSGNLLIADPFLLRKEMNGSKPEDGKNDYYYKNYDSVYCLQSVGPDGLLGTDDDLFPQVNNTSSFKSGFIKSIKK